tara:strand:+ start:423 stop:662 length:240 start_codon:yes stop_codon:yes gene_type:complete
MEATNNEDKMSIPNTDDFIKISECGEYGLLANTELWKIAGEHSYMAGYVMEARNIEIAVVEAKEDARIMWEQARAEFGF